MSHRYTIVRFALGSLLLAAAGLKLYGLSVSAIPRVGWFSQPWVQLGAAEWELVLGLWLLSGAHLRGAWVAALLTFAAFATISGYLGWIGVASCGCFGVIEASPWWAFRVDAAALTAIILFWPSGNSGVEPASCFLSKVMGVGFVTLVILTLVLTIVINRYGSAHAAIARLRGEELLVPSWVDFGTVKHGEQAEQVIEITNWGGRTGSPDRRQCKLYVYHNDRFAGNGACGRDRPDQDSVPGSANGGGVGDSNSLALDG